MKTIDMLINELKTSEAMQKLLMEAAKNKALDAFLKEQGADATAEEFIAALKEQAEQMDDAALDTVAGGACWDEALTSILGFGLSCALIAIASATCSGTGNGTNGRILCNDY